jgi:predicted metal-dependent phosphotriesterase family hydrolase
MAEVTTLLGPVPEDTLGRILPHEHILGVFGHGLSRDLAFEPQPAEAMIAHHEPLLRQLVERYDCRTLVEVSPSGMRRSQELDVWAELSRRTGINIVPATGHYVGPFRPKVFAGSSAAQVATEMISEITRGIEGTSYKAGIIKIAMGDFDEADRKLCQAAAIAQKATGLSITTHTCSPQVRRGVLDYLEGAGVPPERVYLGHADDNATLPELLSLVQRGANVLLTIWGIQNPRLVGWTLPVLPKYHSPGLVAGLVAEGCGDRVLLSIDYAAGLEEPYYEVEGRNYLYMFTHVLGFLRQMGMGDRDIERLMRDNPRRMLLAG